MADTWIEWSPQWAPHIAGRYTERVFDPVARMPEEQKVECRCATCGAYWQTRCSSGSVRQHIQRFAFVHQHKDPLE